MTLRCASSENDVGSPVPDVRIGKCGLGIFLITSEVSVDALGIDGDLGSRLMSSWLVSRWLRILAVSPPG